ncbi:MAG: aminotransferase class I/II-fold pyridoxal phosphate-dependent enzyme [Spirochaetota bacterium]|nr:MAG: aminotransferase class I/II-fold pyridoxal phosphate-dependent enzyme [Spirochaetota bacterium]
MDIAVAERVNKIGSYAFADVDNIVDQLKKEGIEPIDFGVGDPTLPTPEIIRDACIKGLEKRKSSGYPSYIGNEEYRKTVAWWSKQRFGIDLDPDTEIMSTIGSKEAIFNFPETFINPGDYTLALNPGYPAWSRGTHFAEGKTYYLNLLPENKFLPDFGSIPKKVLKKAKLLWINYPNNPTTAFPTKEFYQEVLEVGDRYNIIVASDESYTENYYDEPPQSILGLKRDGVVVFQSLSKRSNMTCYRVGWIAGDSRIISAYKKVKPNIDSGTATFIQDAAIAALKDEKHVKVLREDYRKKRDIIINSFSKIGLERCEPKGTIYLWQKVPDGYTSLDFSKKLLAKEVAVVTTPGSWLSQEAHGVNPGEGFVRLALVPSIEKVKEAARKIENLKL